MKKYFLNLATVMKKTKILHLATVMKKKNSPPCNHFEKIFSPPCNSDRKEAAAAATKNPSTLFGLGPDDDYKNHVWLQ